MPVIKEIEIDEDSRIAIWRIDENIQDLKWGLQWGQKDLEQYCSIKNEDKCLQWLCSRVLLRRMLNTSKFIDLQSDENGKPYLANSTTHLSISHSGKYVAIILSNKEVGIDIQEPRENIADIASKFMTVAELNVLIGEERREEYILAYWTAKEALFKLQGRKKIDYKDDLGVTNLFLSGENGHADGHIDVGSMDKEIDIHYLKVDDYLLAYVIDEE